MSLSSEQKHISGGAPFVYAVPAHTDAKLILLTVGATAVVGNWYGKYGEFFVGYAELPLRDKAREKELGVLQSPEPTN